MFIAFSLFIGNWSFKLCDMTTVSFIIKATRDEWRTVYNNTTWSSKLKLPFIRNPLSICWNWKISFLRVYYNAERGNYRIVEVGVLLLSRRSVVYFNLCFLSETADSTTPMDTTTFLFPREQKNKKNTNLTASDDEGVCFE